MLYQQEDRVLIVQTDCIAVVETMKGGGFSASAGAAIYDDCTMMWNGFDSVSIEHCNREANQVAHELARNDFLSKSTCNCVDEPPSFTLQPLI